jgi:hypothetical protein
MHWLTLKHTTNTMKYTINTINALKIHSNTSMSFKIHLSTIKNTFLCFNIHTYTFQIPCNTFKNPYILLTYITILLLYSNIHILPYTLKLSWNLSIPYFFVLLLHYFSKLSWCLIILPKCHALAMTCLLESINEAYSVHSINLTSSVNI